MEKRIHTKNHKKHKHRHYSSDHSDHSSDSDYHYDSDDDHHNYDSYNNSYNDEFNNVNVNQYQQIANFISTRQFRPLPSVPNFNLQRYMGKWYEIGTSVFVRLFIERGCKCTTANYTLLSNNSVEVFNSCVNQNTNQQIIATGNAIQPNPAVPGELQVSFPQMQATRPNYYVMQIDNNYEYALIGEPTRLFLWILSRKKTVPDSIYKKYLDYAQSQGFNLRLLGFKKTKQNC